MISAPPLEVGASHVRVTDWSLGAADRFSGAVGTPACTGAVARLSAVLPAPNASR